MRIGIFAVALTGIFGCFSTANAQYFSQSQNYNIELNKTEIIRLPEAAGAVVVGNPDIADISVHSSDTLFLIGRGYGNTNLIILNASGQTIMDSDINVVSPRARNNVKVYLGNNSERYTYNCSPYCLPAPILGCLLYTSPSPRDRTRSRMPSSA